MQKVKLIFAALLLMSITLSSAAQSMEVFNPLLFPPFIPPPKYTDCAAILFNGKVLVNDYSPEGICKLEDIRHGTISVATVDLSDDSKTPIKNIGFKVAIQNHRTNTLSMYSDETFQEVRLEHIIEKCEMGDHIIIMTVDQKYSLPHHEIEIRWGC